MTIDILEDGEAGEIACATDLRKDTIARTLRTRIETAATAALAQQ